MNVREFNKALALYGILEEDLGDQLSGGTYNVVFQFEQEGQQYVIRIGEMEIDRETTYGMIKWLLFLKANGAAAPELEPSIRKNFLEFIEVDDRTYSVDVTHKVIGNNARTLVRQSQDLSWARDFGQAVGKIHQLAKNCGPKGVLRVRPEWPEIGNDFIPPMLLSTEEVTITERREEILDQINDWSKTPEVYGLIHLDLHLGNIHIHSNPSTITLLDFDDVSFGWFMMDLVTPITDIWVCHPGENRDEIINLFLVEALDGYQLETQLISDHITQIPLLLDLLEIGLYTRFHKMTKLQQENGWVKTFMTDRKGRIESRIPFVNIQL